MNNAPHPAIAAVDFAGALTILATLFGWLPPLGALLAVVWYLLQIWESKTIQALRKHWSEKHRREHGTGIHKD